MVLTSEWGELSTEERAELTNLVRVILEDAGVGVTWCGTPCEVSGEIVAPMLAAINAFFLTRSNFLHRAKSTNAQGEG